MSETIGGAGMMPTLETARLRLESGEYAGHAGLLRQAVEGDRP